MKIQWEEKDVKCGQCVTLPDTFPSIYRSYKIGYLQGIEKAVYYLIALTDGSILSEAKTKEEMAERLTAENFQPLTVKQLIKMLRESETEILKNA